MNQGAHVRQHHTWRLILQIIFVLICVFMAIRGLAHGQDLPVDVKVAVIGSREDAIEHHLDNTDKNVSAQNDRISILENEMSKANGEGTAAFTILGMIGSATVVLQVKGNKKGGA
jgi:hypothetical protein